MKKRIDMKEEEYQQQNDFNMEVLMWKEVDKDGEQERDEGET